MKEIWKFKAFVRFLTSRALKIAFKSSHQNGSKFISDFGLFSMAGFSTRHCFCQGGLGKKERHVASVMLKKQRQY